jgi:hypothetical protein
MSAKLPYVVQPTFVSKILTKIQDAKTPDRFTQDFLQTKLGFKGGNYRQFIPLAKKLGLLNSDGTPTDLYTRFRNPATSKAAIAQAIKNGYRELFERNEYANKLKKDELKGLIVEVTGLENDSNVVQRVTQTIENLRGLADFDADLPRDVDRENGENAKQDEADAGHEDQGEQRDGHTTKLRLGLSYTINLVLPKTDDAAVFNAIFRSLRENLLRD